MVREDSFAKFLKISGLLLVCLAVFFALIAGLMLGLRAFFGLFADMPAVALMYKLVIVSLPFLLFNFSFIALAGYSRRHSNKLVRLVSLSLIGLSLAVWLLVYALDLIGLAKMQANTLENYYSYDTIFLTSNVGLLILIAVIQALSSPKEKDWMDAHLEEH